MSKPLVTILGKTIKKIAKLRGGGSALPGLVVEKIDPDFAKTTLSDLPYGVVVVSGTNGKTTTTKIVVELLESQGLKVFTNKTGSNFSRGVVAALLGEVDMKGKLNADIAVLELDEAHAVHFVDKIPPRYSLILNVMRDQLDRFGEIDHTANLLRHIANCTTEITILNREDSRIANIAKSLPKNKFKFFGLDEKLIDLFPTDDELHSNRLCSKNNTDADVILTKLDGNNATFLINDKNYNLNLKLSGIYNIFNAAAAVALVKNILKNKINYDSLLNKLEKISPAFGRGEIITVNNTPVELVLVKNPSGFRLGLKSFNPAGYKTMIAINDNYADGRDMSWLWDVDFSSLSKDGVNYVTGIRAYDMALRLQYNDIKTGYVDTNIEKSLKLFLNHSPKTPKRIYCTYTAMLAIRQSLSRITKIKDIE